ncbi:MAG: ligase-associated DNA damage response exonuclease [Desulfobacterales bacterium]|jgi:putative mRNA 3-end processing factor
MLKNKLLETTAAGIYCRPGDFYIDPWQAIDRAVITHAHADHARPDCGRYLAARDAEALLRLRLGEDIRLQPVAYGETVALNGVSVSLHPAGHVLGSAQIRIEYKGEVWVVSGDYKIEKDTTCAAFEQLKCHTFVTESTFGLPVFKWQPQADIFADINGWWRSNQAQAKTSVLFAYSLGKAQRVIAGLDTTIGPVFTHGAVENVNQRYRQAGISLPATRHVAAVEDKNDFVGAMVVAPPSADTPAYMKRFAAISKAFSSGWMQIRGMRRRRAVDRGFVLSDHSDWSGLIGTIMASEAENVWVTHGYSTEVVQYLREQGLNARQVDTRFSSGIDRTEA